MIDRVMSALRAMRPKPQPAAPKPHHRVTFLGPDPQQAFDFARGLFEARSDGHFPLQPAGADFDSLRGINPSPDAPDDAVRLGAALVPKPGRRARSRRLELCVPRSHSVRVGDRRSWKLASDVFVVVWPLDRLGAGTLESDARFQIQNTLGQAVHLGRVRRVAFVITGCSDDEGPRDRGQARLDLDAAPGARVAIRTELRLAVGRPGDPLADPRWRELLEQRVVVDDSLLPLIEATRATLRRGCPLFFVGTAGAADVEPLIEWLGDPTPATPCTGRRTARAMARAAAVACLLSLAFLFTMPGPSRDTLPPYTSMEKLVEHGHRVLDRYASWFGAPAAFAGTATRARLTRAVDVAEFGVEVRAQALALSHQLEPLEAGADLLDEPQRLRRAGAAMRLAGLALKRQAEWTDLHPGVSSRADLLRPWHREITRALLDAALLGLEPRDRGFGGDSLRDRWRAAIDAGLGEVGALRGVAWIDTWLGSGDALTFYRNWLSQRASVADTALVGSIGRTVPRMWLRPEDATGSGLGLLRWRALSRGLGPAAAAEFLRGERAGEVTAMAASPLGSGGAPSPVTIELTTDAVGAWHVDGSSGGLRFRTARSTGPGRAVLRFDRGEPGMTVAFSLNRVRATHVVPGVEPEVRCQPSELRKIVLIAPFEGDVDFGNGFVLHYRAHLGDPGAAATVTEVKP